MSPGEQGVGAGCSAAAGRVGGERRRRSRRLRPFAPLPHLNCKSKYEPKQAPIRASTLGSTPQKKTLAGKRRGRMAEHGGASTPKHFGSSGTARRIKCLLTQVSKIIEKGDQKVAMTEPKAASHHRDSKFSGKKGTPN